MRKYEEYIANIGGVPTDVADFREVQNTPKWSGSATLGYLTDFGGGDLYLGSTVSYKSRTYQFEIPNPYFDQSPYALVDASIVYTAPSGTWSLGVHGKNLTDKRYKTSGYTFRRGQPADRCDHPRRQWLADGHARPGGHADRFLRRAATGVRDRDAGILRPRCGRGATG